MTPFDRAMQSLIYVLAGAILFFLVAPVILVIPMSFSGSRYLDFPPETWSLRWYERLFTSITWSNSLVVSVKLAIATMLVSTPIGVAAAYGLHISERPLLKKLQIVLLLPMIVPNIIIAIGLFYAFVRFNILGSFAGLVAAHATMAVPFVLITTLSALRSFDMSQEAVARSLGCSRAEAFFRVTLPQIRGGVFSGMLFAFVTSLDEVVIALFVATGRNQTVTKVMFGSLRDELDPTIAAVSVVLIVGTLSLGLVALIMRQAATVRVHGPNR
ncbi:MAG: ABC transporter permease [Pseudomonadota bacterium]|nr:ABC transporter permease [Pseudomonadota bacterium]